jgi:multidrug efflux pump subunit AcrB
LKKAYTDAIMQALPASSFSSFRIVIAFAFLSIVGVALIPLLSIDLTPNHALPVFTISYSLPNALPEVVEAEATAVIENEVSQLAGIKKITSVSNYNRGSVEVQFNKNTNVDFKRFEIASLIRNVYPKLNKSLTYPVIENRAVQAQQKKSLLVYSVNAALAPYQIKNTLREKFVKQISQIKGVSEINLSGAEDLQITIAYDIAHLQNRNIQPDQITTALKSHNSNHFFQHQSTSAQQVFPVALGANIPNLSAIENISISDSINSFRLKELANVYWEEQKPNAYFRINSLNSVTLSIYADENVNRI